MMKKEDEILQNEILKFYNNKIYISQLRLNSEINYK